MQESELTTWLLDAATPTIRYQTLVDLLGLPADDPRVIQAQQAIMQNGAVPSILSHQSEAGSWIGENGYYTPKYTSTHWSMMLLTELCVDGADPRFRQGVDFMLGATAAELYQQIESHTPGISCFWGNLLRYALHSSLAEDTRVENVISYLNIDLREGSCLCAHNRGQACAWGVVRALWGLAALPPERLGQETKDAIDRGVQFLLDSFQLVEANYPAGRGKISPFWFRLNFPLFYQSDILFTLRVLDELGILDRPGAQPALDRLAQCRGQDGRWDGSSPFRQRTWKGLGDHGETNRWVSLQASRILLHAGRIQTL